MQHGEIICRFFCCSTCIFWFVGDHTNITPGRTHLSPILGLSIPTVESIIIMFKCHFIYWASRVNLCKYTTH